jgi:hypothetical protein
MSIFVKFIDYLIIAEYPIQSNQGYIEVRGSTYADCCPCRAVKLC